MNRRHDEPVRPAEAESAARLREALGTLSGLPVSRKGFAANSIHIWLGPHPMRDDAIAFLVHPAWQLLIPGRDIVSSDEAPAARDGDDEAAYRAGMERFWRRTDMLGRRRLEQASLIQPQNRLRLVFDGELVLEQWPSSPFPEEDDEGFEDWNLRFYARGERFTVTRDAVVVGTIDSD
ncbi:MAG TPA: hypothetical protein VGB79_12045 [Allosphingosinicella sp.]|jgi:hypothetical protein